jgi:Glucose-6-phosphate dehydrogenase subunit
MAPPLSNVSVADIECRLDELREHETTSQRTSVLTHTAWVPLEWARAAGRVLEGMGPRVPSRTILLHPDPGASETRLDALAEHECFPTGGHETCAETARIWLRGETAKAPASVVAPLQIADLPAFLRWRGRLPFGSAVLDQLVECHDRLVVDSSEWGERLAPLYRRLAELFDRIAVSDLAWARGLPFRAGLAELWPFEAKALDVRGPRADALLLQSWLRSRLKKDVKLRREHARGLRSAEIDGVPVRVRRRHVRSGSDLLSDELEVFTRDPIYEAAVRSV